MKANIEEIMIDIKVGDLVVTSGLGGRYPPGYPIGDVTKVEIDHGEPFATIIVTPSAQVSRAREVLLVWPEPKENNIDQVSGLAPAAAADDRCHGLVRALEAHAEERHVEDIG